MGHEPGDRQAAAGVYQPCDKRFRTSKYFLDDQLKCSDALSDFRSVKNLVNKTQAFNVRGAFQFQTQTVPVRTDR
jgi:hypothetical protein